MILSRYQIIHDISPVYLSKSDHDAPQKLRLNCSHIIFYPPVPKNHCNLTGKEHMVDPKLRERLEPYELLFLQTASLSEMALKAGVKGLYNLGRLGTSKAIKSNFVKKEIKGMAEKCIAQALDSFTSNVSRKLYPFIHGGQIDHS